MALIKLRKVVALILAALLLEAAGYLIDLRPSEVINHYVFFPIEKRSLEDRYGIQFKDSIEINNYPENEGSNHLLDDQTEIEPVHNQYHLSRSLQTVKSALNKYPNEIFSDKLLNIYLLDNLTIRGSESGGTYDVEKNSIYLLNYYAHINNHSLVKNLLESTIHHEISSILIKNYHFDYKKWREAMGTDFKYQNDIDPTYEWMFINGHIDSVDEKTLLDRGLLRQYAETGAENDFNIYASVIFTEPNRMSRLIAQNSLIAKKYATLKKFYLSIDPGFRAVFDEIDGSINNPSLKNNADKPVAVH